jgi:hypothetical protein
LTSQLSDRESAYTTKWLITYTTSQDFKAADFCDRTPEVGMAGAAVGVGVFLAPNQHGACLRLAAWIPAYLVKKHREDQRRSSVGLSVLEHSAELLL